MPESYRQQGNIQTLKKLFFHETEITFSYLIYLMVNFFNEYLFYKSTL